MIDLNADVGEGAGFDDDLVPLVSSCNIACTAHAGDDQIIRNTVLLAKKHNVVIGAHPSYADRANFGRVVVPLAAHEISELVRWQVQKLLDAASAEDVLVRYVKPHGALYNEAARNPIVADAIIAGIVACDRSLMVMGLAHSALTTAATNAGLQPIHEGFIDRMYEADGTLRARHLPSAVHADEQAALNQALQLAQHMPIQSYAGTPMNVHADSLCIHGDTPHAVQFAQRVRAAFAQQQIAIGAAYLRR